MSNPGIYILTNKVNGKQYVGMDSNLPRRSRTHLKGKEKGCKAIYNAIQKYGPAKFDVEIICYPGISWAALCEVEKWKIRQLGTFEDGYNQTRGGDGFTGEFTEEHRSKIKANHKGMSGKKQSEETRQKISESLKKHIRTDQHSNNISNSLKGRKLPLETRQKMSQRRKEQEARKQEKRESYYLSLWEENE